MCQIDSLALSALAMAPITGMDQVLNQAHHAKAMMAIERRHLRGWWWIRR